MHNLSEASPDSRFQFPAENPANTSAPDDQRVRLTNTLADNLQPLMHTGLGGTHLALKKFSWRFVVLFINICDSYWVMIRDILLLLNSLSNKNALSDAIVHATIQKSHMRAEDFTNESHVT